MGWILRACTAIGAEGGGGRLHVAGMIRWIGEYAVLVHLAG